MSLQAKIRSAVGHAQEVSSYYRLHFIEGRHTFKSVDKLREIAGGHLGKEIDYYYHPLPYSGQAVQAACLRLEDKYEIFILKGQNFCWTRLILCKEIFQVVIDEDDYQIPNIASLVNQVVASVPEAAGNLPILSESLAEIAALEFLFPYSDREGLLRLKQGETPDFPEIAERYKIPRVMVEKYLSQPWMDILRPEGQA